MKKDSVIIFFHGYGSSVNTDKFVKIPYTNKKAIQLDYDKGLKETLQVAENFAKEQLKEYTDFIYSPVLAAIGISILEDNVAVSK